MGIPPLEPSVLADKGIDLFQFVLGCCEKTLGGEKDRHTSRKENAKGEFDPPSVSHH